MRASGPRPSSARALPVDQPRPGTGPRAGGFGLTHNRGHTPIRRRLRRLANQNGGHTPGKFAPKRRGLGWCWCWFPCVSTVRASLASASGLNINNRLVDTPSAASVPPRHSSPTPPTRRHVDPVGRSRKAPSTHPDSPRPRDGVPIGATSPRPGTVNAATRPDRPRDHPAARRPLWLISTSGGAGYPSPYKFRWACYSRRPYGAT